MVVYGLDGALPTAGRYLIGRGLRLCVNQQGHRVRGFEVNTLTVVATSSDKGDALTVFPTLSESIKLTALSFRTDIDKLSCCI